MKLLQMRAENFKRVVLVEIRPDGTITTVGGDNEAGKSSTLDAFEYALEGPQKDTPTPIREGADKSVIVLEFDDIIVKRTTTPKGQSLVVKNREGAQFASPQAMLDKLFSKIANDPLAFIAMKEDAQLDTLKRLVRLDFKEMDDERKQMFESRTDLGRDERRLQTELAGLPADAEPPAARVSIADLTESLKAGEREQKNLSYYRSKHQAVVAALAERQARALELQAELNRVNAEIAEQTVSVIDAETALKEQQTKIVDTEAIRTMLLDAEGINRRFDQAEARAAKAKELEAVKLKVSELTSQIESIDTTKALMLKQATFPLDGLALTDTGVTFKGVPLTQVCKSDQIRIGVAVAMALNPKLRVMLIRDGSLIGPERRRLLEELATEHDAQILMEVVTTDASEVSVLIEDGRVAGVPVEA